MRILIVEDMEYRIKQFVFNLIGCTIEVTKSSQEAIDLLKTQHWDCLLLDHDLEGPVFFPSGPGTGYEVACWLEENSDRQPKVIITHSQNPEGARNICRALPNAMAFPKCWELTMLKAVLEAIHEGV
jgi:CheY-like chemotaxis protein